MANSDVFLAVLNGLTDGINKGLESRRSNAIEQRKLEIQEEELGIKKIEAGRKSEKHVLDEKKSENELKKSEVDYENSKKALELKNIDIAQSGGRGKKTKSDLTNSYLDQAVQLEKQRSADRELREELSSKANDLRPIPKYANEAFALDERVKAMDSQDLERGMQIEELYDRAAESQGTESDRFMFKLKGLGPNDRDKGRKILDRAIKKGLIGKGGNSNLEKEMVKAYKDAQSKHGWE